MQRLLLILALAMAGAAHPQTPFRTELLELSGQLQALAVRAERLKKEDIDSRIELKRDLINARRLIYQLAEDANNANLALAGASQPADRNTLLAISATDALLLSRSLLFAYVDTRDPVFLKQINSAIQTARTLQNAIK